MPLCVKQIIMDGSFIEKLMGKDRDSFELNHYMQFVFNLILFMW